MLKRHSRPNRVRTHPSPARDELKLSETLDIRIMPDAKRLPQKAARR